MDSRWNKEIQDWSGLTCSYLVLFSVSGRRKPGDAIIINYLTSKWSD